MYIYTHIQFIYICLFFIFFPPKRCHEWYDFRLAPDGMPAPLQPGRWSPSVPGWCVPGLHYGIGRLHSASASVDTKWPAKPPIPNGGLRILIYIYIVLYLYTLLYEYNIYICIYIYVYVWLVFLKIYSRLCIRPAVDFHTFFRWQGWPVSWSWVDLLAALASCPPTPKAGWEGMVSSIIYVRWYWYGYGSIPINTIFSGMNIHLPAILMFTRGTRFWHTAILPYSYY